MVDVFVLPVCKTTTSHDATDTRRGKPVCANDPGVWLLAQERFHFSGKSSLVFQVRKNMANDCINPCQGNLPANAILPKKKTSNPAKHRLRGQAYIHI